MVKPSQRISRKIYRIFRVIVRCISVCAILLVVCFVFLRLHGVPDPVLREIIRRVNAAGVSIDVDEITLTLRGWRASNVRYYSNNPDDLIPVVCATDVWFRVVGGHSSGHWGIDIEVADIGLCPSIDWGVQIPAESVCRSIDEGRVSLVFYPGHIEVLDGEMSWLGIDFELDGTLSLPDSGGWKAPVKQRIPQEGPYPICFSEKHWQKLEDQLKSFSSNGEAVLAVDFFVDFTNLAKSRVDCRVHAEEVAFRDVLFDRVELVGFFDYPVIGLNEASLSMNNQSLQVNGEYDLSTTMVQGNVRNSITSKQLLLLLPQTILDFLIQAELRFGYLPTASVAFGPAKPAGLLNAISGSFSIRDVAYCDLGIDSLSGCVDRSEQRLELTQLEGTVNGQEFRADEVGSCMVGGAMTGSVFWDANKNEFGVKAQGSMDPNLFIAPLAIVPVATNAIGRFKFKDQVPHVSLELGADYTNWKTFYINVHGTGNEVQLHDAIFTSVNASGFYSGGVLRLEPIAVMQGVDFMKGTAAIDFLESTAAFDVFGSLEPEILEDAIYPRFHLFGNKIKAFGNVNIKARGLVDWKTMKKTEFQADVEADYVEIPVAKMDHLSAKVSGHGPLVSVTNAVFGLCGGKAVGDFSIQLDPRQKEMPYDVDLNVEQAEFRDIVLFIKSEVEQFAGKLFGHISFRSDMTKDFFETATGYGNIEVKDGQLADLPFFRGFSRVVRKVVPGFNAFSITSLKGAFDLDNGVILTKDAYFGGDVMSAKVRGSYSGKTGFDAIVQGQIMNDNRISKVLRVITDPFFKLFQMKLEGAFTNPSWKLENFTAGSKTPNSKAE